MIEDRELHENASVAAAGDLAAVSELSELYVTTRPDASSTRRNYRRHLSRFVGHCRSVGVATVGELTTSALAAYRGTLLELGPSNRRQAIAAVRSFLGWLASQGYRVPGRGELDGVLPLPRARGKKTYVSLTESEIRRLLDRSRLDPRDLVIVALLLGCGLRREELSALRVEELQEQLDGQWLISVRQGKGGKDRSVPVPEDAVPPVLAYLAATRRSLGSSGPLLLRRDRRAREGEGLSAQTINRRVAALAVEAGIDHKRVTAHVLRHTFALRYLLGGGNVRHLQLILGHASLETTQVYLAQLETAALGERMPPLRSLGRRR